MENKILLDRLSPFIGPHRHFDIVLSKFGPVYVYPVDRAEECHEAQVLDNHLEIVETVAFQMLYDKMEPTAAQRTTPTEEEIEAVRTRIQALVSGLDFEDECMRALERYINLYER